MQSKNRVEGGFVLPVCAQPQLDWVSQEWADLRRAVCRARMAQPSSDDDSLVELSESDDIDVENFSYNGWRDDVLERALQRVPLATCNDQRQLVLCGNKLTRLPPAVARFPLVTSISAYEMHIGNIDALATLDKLEARACRRVSVCHSVLTGSAAIRTSSCGRTHCARFRLSCCR